VKHSLTGAALLMMAACGGATTAPSPGVAGGLYTSAHFRFQYAPLDAANIERTAEAVEREYARIIADLRAGSMPTVNVTFYTDHSAMAAATRPVAGVVPPWASGLVTSSSEIHMMSLNAPEWGPYERRLSGLVHEFAHCVSMRINPGIPNRPRWLWEAVAIYEAGESVDLRGLDYMRALTPPSFEMLNSFDNTRVYQVGYSIAEFVVSRWGAQALVDLVIRGGDTVAVLNIPLTDFERDWFAFARQRYGF
jgi:hypothetical protein